MNLILSFILVQILVGQNFLFAQERYDERKEDACGILTRCTFKKYVDSRAEAVETQEATKSLGEFCNGGADTAFILKLEDGTSLHAFVGVADKGYDVRLSISQNDPEVVTRQRDRGAFTDAPLNTEQMNLSYYSNGNFYVARCKK